MFTYMWGSARHSKPVGSWWPVRLRLLPCPTTESRRTNPRVRLFPPSRTEPSRDA